MIIIVSCESIVNLLLDLTRTMVRKYFTQNCPACPVGQFAQRSAATVDTIPYTLPSQTFKIDFKGLWSAPKGAHNRSLSDGSYTFKSLDLVADYAYIACTLNRRTGNRLFALYSDNEFFVKQAQQLADSDRTSKVSLLPSISDGYDRVWWVEQIYCVI